MVTLIFSFGQLQWRGLQIYVDTDDDLRLSRRILRDIEERGRDLRGVIAQYTRFVKPAQDRFVAPSRRVADVIIPWHECVRPLLATVFISLSYLRRSEHVLYIARCHHYMLK
jgi:uridine kinase